VTGWRPEVIEGGRVTGDDEPEPFGDDDEDDDDLEDEDDD
jgi:hypothetical protein